MKITITLKDPDGVYDCVQDAIKEEIANIPSLSEDEREALLETRTEEVFDKLRKWIEYKEYVMVEFDTEANTATVKEI